MGYKISSIHGSMTVADRDRIVEEFKATLTTVLIATDVLARGSVELVVNYTLPYNSRTRLPNYEVYLHRVGRAGRFGKKDNGPDKEMMEKIDNHFGANVKEISPWNSEEEYTGAIMEAGLLA